MERVEGTIMVVGEGFGLKYCLGALLNHGGHRQRDTINTKAAWKGWRGLRWLWWERA